MDENTNKKTVAVRKDLSYDDKVIKKIAGIATEGVDGIITVSGGLVGSVTDRMRTDDKTKGIAADVGKRQVALDLNVVCEYGKYVPGLFDAVVANVSKAIREMTGLEVVEVNMRVQDVLRKAEFESMRQKRISPPEEEEETALAPAAPHSRVE